MKEGGQLVLQGDTHADSSGHCAKYSTFTLLDGRHNKIVDTQLVQQKVRDMD